VVLVSLLSVAVEFVSGQHCPVLFVSVSLRFKEALSLKYLIVSDLLLAKPLDNRIVALNNG
jgi:hypothetical protein